MPARVAISMYLSMISLLNPFSMLTFPNSEAFRGYMQDAQSLRSSRLPARSLFSSSLRASNSAFRVLQTCEEAKFRGAIGPADEPLSAAGWDVAVIRVGAR